MSSSPMTSPARKCGGVLEDFSGLTVYQWSIDPSMQGPGDTVSSGYSERKLAASLKSAITCLLSLYRNQSTYGHLFATGRIATKLERGDTKYCEIYATHLSWMSLCDMARRIVIETCGSSDYTTPLSVSAQKEKHEDFKRRVIKHLEEVLRAKEREEGAFGRLKKIYSFISKGERALSIYIRSKEGTFRVTGAPDFLLLLLGESEQRGWRWPVLVTGEVSTSQALEHIVHGEMLGYMMQAYMTYGTRVAGLIATPSRVLLLIPRIPEKDLEGTVPVMLERLFLSPSEERLLERVERLRSIKPWACTLCDLRSLCPLSHEG